MPDWRQIVRQRLRVLAVFSPELAEELAAHLEDSYEALLSDGLRDDEAFRITVGQIEGHHRIRLVTRFLREDLMTRFIRDAALPLLLTSAAAYLFHWALAQCPLSPTVLWLVGGQLPLWWWCLLPICGALGALLSADNGRSPWQRIAASQIPGATLGILVLLVFGVGFTLSGFVNWPIATQLETLGIVPPGFAVIPAAFSLLGAGISEASTKKFGRLA